MTWKDINITDTIVLLIIIIIVFISVKYYFIPKTQNMPSHTITLNDADGLIVGSPVLFSGNEVGHVTKLKFEDNQVHVTFVFDKKNIKEIPKHSEITIKATGIAASKALEIYHDPKNITKDLYIRDSIRQVAAKNVQVNINRQIIQATSSANVVMSDKQLIELKELTQNGIVNNGIIKVFDKLILADEIFDTEMNNNKKLKDINKKLKNINKKLEQNEDANKK